MDTMSNSLQSPFLRTESGFTQFKAPISSLSSQLTELKNCIVNQHEVQQTRVQEITNLPIKASSLKSLDRNEIQSQMSDTRRNETKEGTTSHEQEFEGHQFSQILLCPEDLNSLVSCLEPI